MMQRNEDHDDPRKTYTETARDTGMPSSMTKRGIIGNNNRQDEEEIYEDAPINQGLLSRKRKTIHSHYQHGKIVDPYEWTRPYWLGSGLFLILFAFWLLDSLKDPIFVKLVDGKISQHQPPAKLCSVLVTLVLVCVLEFWTNLRNQQKRDARIQKENEITPDESVMDPGGVWKRAQMKTAATLGDEDQEPSEQAMDDIVSFDIFYHIGIPYVVAFSVLSYCVWRFEGRVNQQILISTTTSGSATESSSLSMNDQKTEENPLGYYILGYILYATVESFGSLAVAAFWSYTNSTLSLNDAERYYGPIIATAQLGAIGGSTLVATGRWDSSNLLYVVVLTIVLQLLLMREYDRRFEPTSLLVADQQSAFDKTSHDDDNLTVMTEQDAKVTRSNPFWSGLRLIFNHSYVLLILGVSCLYEVAMTLLDYQMKLLGVAKFSKEISTTMPTNDSMSFAKFMGHYGQLVNVTSLLFSSLLFPFLIRRFGLRRTLLGFPTMLLIVTFLAYGALPGNLTVLFVSLSVLKAMTYSIHDPSKELLYIPTSNAIKFRAKFWIDVVGERISKAIGSAFNTLAKDIRQSLRIGAVPSLLSAFGLWLVCYYVGKRFDKLLATGKIIGLEHSIDPSTYSRVGRNEDDDDSCHGRNYNHYREEPDEVEISFDECDVSTLDLMTDPVLGEKEEIKNSMKSGIEMPYLSRI